MGRTRETVEVASERLARLIEDEQRTKPKAAKDGDVLPTVDAITCEWLTDVLCGKANGTEVIDFEITLVSAGTHARHRLQVTYNQEADGTNLPTSLFTKTLPTVENRMMVGITGHARTEGGFYTQLRPELELEIPSCYHSTVDRESCAAIHILEDLVATKGATFTNYETYVTREMAEDMVDLLAGLHGHFYNDPRFENAFKWVAPFTRWFMGGVTKLHVDRSTELALTQAADHLPQRLLATPPAPLPGPTAVSSIACPAGQKSRRVVPRRRRRGGRGRGSARGCLPSRCPRRERLGDARSAVPPCRNLLSRRIRFPERGS